MQSLEKYFTASYYFFILVSIVIMFLACLEINIAGSIFYSALISVVCIFIALLILYVESKYYSDNQNTPEII